MLLKLPSPARFRFESHTHKSGYYHAPLPQYQGRPEIIPHYQVLASLEAVFAPLVATGQETVLHLLHVRIIVAAIQFTLGLLRMGVRKGLHAKKGTHLFAKTH